MDTKHENVKTFLEYIGSLADDNKKHPYGINTDYASMVKASMLFFNRDEEVCSWFVPNMKLIDVIQEMHERTKLPIHDMGCGYGLMVALLNYLDIDCYGFDDESELKRDRMENLTRLLSPFNITTPDTSKFIKQNITEDQKCGQCILFESWGRYVEPVDNYIKHGGKYIIIVGEGKDGCTWPFSGYVEANYTNIKSSQKIIIPQWNCIHDDVRVTELK